jgi:hypothetical protein
VLRLRRGNLAGDGLLPWHLVQRLRVRWRLLRGLHCLWRKLHLHGDLRSEVLWGHEVRPLLIDTLSAGTYRVCLLAVATTSVACTVDPLQAVGA